MKYIQIDLEQEIWLIPLKFIAEHRANYYKEKDGEDFDYESEINFIMEDDFEGEDWISNNMNLEDFEGVLIKIPKKPTDADWVNAEKRIIDKDFALGRRDE